MKTGDILDGRYRIVRTLGAGSMGTVYLAEHLLIKRSVAIKTLRPELMGATEVLDDFIAEARAAGTLEHPNIVACTDTGFTSAQVPYLVLEYLDGTVLTDEIYRLGGLPVRRALKIADQIAAALAAAHAADIVHHNLTSDNVFLIDRPDARDVVKVLDFGTARLFGLPDGSRYGVASGAPEFMAPEQLTGTEVADHRADVYALGVILYEMLTARRPFSDDDRRALQHRVVNEPPPPLQRSDAPGGLERLILTRLLAKDPARRCATMAEVRDALDTFGDSARTGGPVSGEIVASARPDRPPRPAPLPVPAEAIALPALPSRRPARLVWLLAAAIAAATGGAAMYLETQTRTAAEQVVADALDGDAEKLAGLIDTEVRAAQLRADSVAATPMLRAGIETDAATLKDLAGTEYLFAPRPGEVLALFQIRGGEVAPVLRIPADAPAIPPPTSSRARVVKDGDRLTIIASAPIARQKGGIGGMVALSAPVDLAPLKRRISEHALSATLVGLGAPLQLAGAAAAAPNLAVPVPLGSDLVSGEVALSAVVAPPAVRPELRVGGLACWGLAGVMLALFIVSLFRGRTRG